MAVGLLYTTTMRTIWLSLAWKEWNEHKWKLVSMVAILWGVIGIAMLAEDTDRIGLACGMVGMCTIPLALFVGLGVAANERARNTLPFLQALPVPLWHAALAKFTVGLLT